MFPNFKNINPFSLILIFFLAFTSCDQTTKKETIEYENLTFTRNTELCDSSKVLYLEYDIQNNNKIINKK